MRRTVAAVLADGLARAGAARLFAAPGAPRPLTEAVRAAGLDVVDVATAYGACIMAAVTGEMTEHPGAAWAPLSGNVTPLVGALAAAARDRAPAIVISEPGADARLLAPAVRASVVADAASVSHWIAHAARAAMNEPRGPVHLAIDARALGAGTVPAAASCVPDAPPALEPAALDALAGAIGNAQRPLVVTGLGCRAADAPWIRAFAEAVPAPVLATPKGKGVLPDPHPLSLGAWAADHAAARRADLVIALGVAAGEISSAGWPEVVVNVARSSDAPPARATIVGDIAAVLEELAPRLRGRARADWDIAELDRIRRAMTAPPAPHPFSLARAVVVARDVTPAGTLATFDSPLAERWQALAPHECLVPAGYATAGYALPAAVAAALASGRLTVAVATFRNPAVAAEWQTATRLGLTIVVIASADAGSGHEHAARAADVPVSTAADETDLRNALDAASTRRRPTLVQVEANRKQRTPT